MADNIIEIVNNDCIIEIEDEKYELCADNITVLDYGYALNKPKINSVELSGDKSATDLGLLTSEDISVKEDISNKVTILNADVSNVQYPSAKCVYDVLEQKANIDLNNLSISGQAILDNKVNISLDNLSTDAEKHFLNKTQITNCLTEIPQKIKLELNNGTLTLKAGSKIIVPNGFETDGVTPKFDDVTVTNDTNFAYTGGTASSIGMIFYRPSINTLYLEAEAFCLSGTTPPTPTCTFYNTNENKVKRYSSSSLDFSDVSFPICEVTFGTSIGGGNVALNQIFNGIGYIGSTVFVDKGVKGLIPDGRNADGSLKNIEFETERVLTAILSFGNQDYYLGFILPNSLNFFGKTITDYIESKNEVFDKITGLYHRDWGFIGSFKGDSNNVISNFQAQTTFHALDYNEYQQNPHIISTYINGTSGYRIWSDGYCEQWGKGENGTGTKTVTLVKNYSDTNYSILQQATGSGGYGSYYSAIVSVSASSFTVSIGSNFDNGFSWLTKGYLAEGEY